MLRNYLLTAVRSLGLRKGYSLINIGGLAIGIASALLIFLYISNELSYDTIHPDADQVYRLGHTHTDEDGSTNDLPFVPGGWGVALKEQYPEVINSARSFWFGYPVSVNNEEGDKILLTEKLLWVESTYPDVLYFETLKGNPEEALKVPNAIALNASIAKSLFGEEDPIGKSLKINHPVSRGQELVATVSAIYADYPDNVHIQPDYLLNIEILKPVFGDFYDQLYGGWTNFGPDTYVKLSQGADLDKLQVGLSALVKEHQAEAAVPDVPIFRPVKDLHFDSEVNWVNEGAGEISYIYIFGSIAILILLIAGINYMNLATARSTKRAVEIGLRKTMGGSRKQLISQFFGESGVTTFFATILSIGLVLLALPMFNDLSQKSFSFADVFQPDILLTLLLIAIFVAIVSGIYPALYLSGFQPVEVLKGRFTSGKGPERFRKTLVVFQFAISVLLIICTAIMLNQMRFISDSKLNQSGEQMLSIRFGGNAPADKYEIFKTELLNSPRISEVTMANHLPRQEYFGNIDADFRFPSIDGNEYNWNLLNTDRDFPETFDLEVIAGKGFDATDDEQSNSYLINESGMKALDLSPEEVVGMAVNQSGNDTLYAGQVIGIVKDFPYRSMHQSIEPLLISTRPNPIDKIVYVKLPQGQFAASIAETEASWKSVFPGIGFDYWFISDEFSRMYVGEERISALTRVFAGLALIVACLGVFGLASFLADRKTKEIGIRKILGARIHHIVNLLAHTFVITILIASVISVPISYFLMRNWLQNFVYHVDLSAWVFVGAILLVLLLTLASISFVTLRAAMLDPIKFIRDE